MSEVYHDFGAVALFLAASHLRELACVESMCGNVEECLFLSQLALELRRIAAGVDPHSAEGLARDGSAASQTVTLEKRG